MACIAVVDDSRLIRVFAATALRKAGHEVLQIEPDSLQAVLDALTVAKPDLLVLDHAMPAFEGARLVRTCFEDPELSKIKILILTATHDEAMAERMKHLDVGAILHKPVRHEDLTEAVDRMLQGPPKRG